RNKTLSYLRPDGKVQVTVRYGDDGSPSGVDNVVLSTQHHDEIDAEQMRADIAEHVIAAVVPVEMRSGQVRTFINPTGRFVIGGPVADAGLTGPKIRCYTYSAYARHGGGCFSGKDPTKVDRAGAYGARHVAKNVVAAGGAGTRLWPRSRRATPKHVLPLAERHRPLLRATYDRAKRVADEVFILTETGQREIVAAVLPEVDADHVILEPSARGTTNAYGL